MDAWLQNFAYHITMSMTSFVLAGVAMFTITFITIGAQIWRAANTEPAEVLRSE
jgi:putative ABC transport system permease protein